MNDEPGGGYRKHGDPAEVIALAAAAALGLEAIFPAGAPGWVLPASEIIASSGSAFVTWAFTGRKAFPLYMTALGGWLGGWTGWAHSAGLWHWATMGGWVAGLGAAVPFGVLAWHSRKPKPEPLMLTAVPEPLMLAPEPDENEVQRRLFAEMFADYGLIAGEHPLTRDPVLIDVYSLTEEQWGRQVKARLPKSGKVTVEQFRSNARNFEVALEAQEGAVMFETGATSSDLVMKVRERDGLAQPAYLTPAVRSRTVTEPVIIGIQEDGTYLKMQIREIHALIIGTTGSGKSNLINVLIAQLASCVDTIIWAIDMKGGRAIAPWFQAWEEGRTDRPPIDWIATTRAEAEIMMTALDQAVETRMRSKIGRSKITPSAGRPQVILICDETADLLGDSRGTRTLLGEAGGQTNTWFIGKADVLTQKGRSEAVTTIWASQRGTTSMGGSTDMKANVNVRIALKPAQLSELQWIVPDLPPLAGKQLQYLADTPGVGMMGIGPRASQPTKFIHHDHIQDVCGADDDHPACVPDCPVYQTAVDTAPVRPRLDALTAQALGANYAQRWVRAQRDGVVRVPQAALSGGSALHGYAGGSDGFEELVRDLKLEDPERDVPPARRRVRELLPTRASGWTPKQLRDILVDEFGDEAPVRETVQKWLKADKDAGLCHHPGYRNWRNGPGPSVSDDED